MATKSRHLKTAMQLWVADQRKAGGYSSLDLATWTGVSEDTARGWESRGRPSEDAIRILERKFGTPAPAGDDSIKGDQSALIASLERFTSVITDAIERVAPPKPAIQSATVIPSRDKKTRRVHWLALAMTRRGWTIPQAAAEIGRDATIVGRWLNGTTLPRGAELHNLARALDIPEALIEDPPATDAERLARWHFGDDESQLRQAM